MANTTIYPRMMIYTDTTGKIYDALSGEEVGILPPGMTPFWGYFLDKDGIEHHISELFGGGGSGSAFNFMGTVPTSADLPTDAEKGDAYQTEDTRHLWAYNGTEWSDLGEVSINLDNYYTKAQTDVKFDDHTRASDTKYQGKLTAGANITISDTNVIAATAGVFSVLTDGETVLGDGVTIPLSSPQQGSKFTMQDDGTPFPSVDAIPKPYDPLAVYLVEERTSTLTALPDVGQMVAGEDGVLHTVGETHNALPAIEQKISQHDTQLESMSAEIDGNRAGINNLTTALSDEIAARQNSDTYILSQVGNVSSALTLESTKRSQADTAMQEEIDAIQEAGYLTDAPSDGKQYARQNGSWSEVTGGGYGTEIDPVWTSDKTSYYTKDEVDALAITNHGIVERSVTWSDTSSNCDIIIKYKGNTVGKIWGRASYPDSPGLYDGFIETYYEENDWTEYVRTVTASSGVVIIEFATDELFASNMIIYRETLEKPSSEGFKLTKWVQKETGDGIKTNFPLTKGTAMFVQGVRIKHTDDSISILWQEDDYVLESDNSITLTTALGNGDVVGFEYVGRA